MQINCKNIGFADYLDFDFYNLCEKYQLLDFFYNIVYEVSINCTDNLSYSFQDRKFLFCRSIVHTFISEMCIQCISLILNFDDILCQIYKLLKLVVFFCMKGVPTVEVTPPTAFNVRRFCFADLGYIYDKIWEKY